MDSRQTEKPFRLGDLVVASCDEARRVTADPTRAAQVASRQLAAWLARLDRRDLIRRLQTT